MQKHHQLFLMTSSFLPLFFLMGCGEHTNPLLSLPIPEVVQMISQAEKTAMEDTHILYTSGSVYAECLTNPGNFAPLQPISEGERQCNRLMQAMLSSAHQQPHFQDLSLADLKDKQVLPRIHDALSDQDGG